jgi:hypothetical protein
MFFGATPSFLAEGAKDWTSADRREISEKSFSEI